MIPCTATLKASFLLFFPGPLVYGSHLAYLPLTRDRPRSELPPGCAVRLVPAPTSGVRLRCNPPDDARQQRGAPEPSAGGADPVLSTYDHH